MAIYHQHDYDPILHHRAQPHQFYSVEILPYTFAFTEHDMFTQTHTELYK